MNTLDNAIRLVLAHQRGAPSRSLEELAECATQARRLVDISRNTLMAVEYPESVRSRTALALLMAAIDQAWGFCHVLATAPGHGHFAALTLYRPLVETLLRGAFFAKPATDAEVAYFLEKNQMPSRAPLHPRPGQSGKKIRLPAGELAIIVSKAFELEPHDRLPQVVQSEIEGWHGMVHGGREVVQLYGGRARQRTDGTKEPLGASTAAEEMFELVPHVAVLAWLAMRAAVTLGKAKQDQRAYQAAQLVRDSYQSFILRWDPPRD